MFRPSTAIALAVDPLRLLKDATAADHAALEQSPLLQRLLDPTLRPQEYQDILVGMHACVAACEARLAAAQGVWQVCALNWSQRLVKTEWLRADLAQLGLSAPEGSPAALTAAPTVDSLAAAAGMFYVLEGSTLGSRVILAAVAQASAQPARGALRYFHGYGSQTLPLWQQWRADCRKILEPDPPLAQAAASTAVATFRFFHHGLAR